MDRLLNLRTVYTSEINSQAEEIINLMDVAVKENCIIYTTKPNESMHPFIHHTLIGNGYKISYTNEIIFAYYSYKKYLITI